MLFAVLLIVCIGERETEAIAVIDIFPLFIEL